MYKEYTNAEIIKARLGAMIVFRLVTIVDYRFLWDMFQAGCFFVAPLLRLPRRLCFPKPETGPRPC